MADRPTGNPKSTRSVVHAPNGMVATSQPLASIAGLRILQQNGNAFDAAVAAAATLAVVEPAMTGLGGDMFALMYSQKYKKVEGLNGSGRAPKKATIDYFLSKGFKEVPKTGILSVTTPGIVDGWAETLKRHGTMTFSQVLQPAIEYAEKGFPVSEIIAAQWRRCESLLRRNKEATSVYLPNNRPPREGEIFKQPQLAKTLRAIADGGRDAFYKGEIARNISDSCECNGGLLSYDDLASHKSTWVNPIKTDYKGHHVYQMPPNTQGITTLEMLNMIENFDICNFEHNSAEYLHLLIEAKKLAYADRDYYVSDPKFADVPVNRLLSKEYALKKSQLINHSKALENIGPGLDLKGDTVYLSVVDKDRNVVSFINSIFGDFGSGIVPSDTGVVLQNRGAAFSLDKNHSNRLEPGKRPFHTIIPSMVLKDDKPYFSFGVMGGDMQPQGQVQVLLNLLEFGMSVQEAGEVARFRHDYNETALESEISSKTKLELIEKGHKLISSVDVFGGYQGILIDPATNMLQGGSDPRKDGCAVGY